MVSIKDEAKPAIELQKKPISLLAWTGEKSVTREIWKNNLGAVKNFFSGGTDEEDEDKAFNIIMKSESYAELAFMVNGLTWDVLDDELDEGDNTKIAARLSTLRDRDEHAIDAVLRRLALKPETFAGSQAAVVDQSIRDRVRFLGRPGRVTLANDLISRRLPLLSSLGLFALRGLPTRSRELIALVDDLMGQLPAQASQLRSLRWEASYDNFVCGQLALARYRSILNMLPDVVDATLPPEQRRALFDTLNRRDAEFRAMQSLIDVMGTTQQRTDVGFFMDARALIMNNFTVAPPTPAIIRTIAALFNSVAAEIAALRADVANATQGLIDSLTLGHITESEKDDQSREVVGVLGERRAVLPFQWKSTLIRMMEEGNCDDDDEQAILQVLTDSKARSIAEFAQLVAAQGWESLSFSFDGQEYDNLELLLSQW